MCVKPAPEDGLLYGEYIVTHVDECSSCGFVTLCVGIPDTVEYETGHAMCVLRSHDQQWCGPNEESFASYRFRPLDTMDETIERLEAEGNVLLRELELVER